MDSGAFNFRIGGFRCITIQDAHAYYPIAMFLTNVATDRYEHWLRERGEDPGKIQVPYLCFFIDTGRERVLVDTGAGPTGSSPHGLMPLLQNQGITAADIDIVFLTHGHGDHLNGCLDAGGKPAFPNARFLIGRKEHDFWMSTPSLDGTPIRADYRKAMVENAQRIIHGIEAQLEVIEPATEIVAGIRTLAAFGHTPGHLGLEISSSSEQLLLVADAIIHPLHLRLPEAISAVDYDPSATTATRIQLLERGASTNCLLAASHLPFPGLGHAVREHDCWRWQPIGEAPH